MKDIKSILMQTARNKGICADGYKEMGADDMDALVDYYVANPDWCMERDFPDLTTLAAHFADREAKGVYVGKTFHGELLNDLQTYIFHDCKGTIKVGLNVDKGIIPMLYVANGCRIRIVGVGSGKGQRQIPRVPVYSFGKNDISARSNGCVQFTRYANDLL